MNIKTITDFLSKCYRAVSNFFDVPSPHEFASEQEREEWDDYDIRQW
jgi:hypothetical protein